MYQGCYGHGHIEDGHQQVSGGEAEDEGICGSPELMRTTPSINLHTFVKGKRKESDVGLWLVGWLVEVLRHIQHI